MYQEKILKPSPEYKNVLQSTNAQKLKTDEHILKEITVRNVKCVEEISSLKIIIYYDSGKTLNIVIKNNCRTTTLVLQTNIVVPL